MIDGLKRGLNLEARILAGCIYLSFSCGQTQPSEKVVAASGPSVANMLEAYSSIAKTPAYANQLQATAALSWTELYQKSVASLSADGFTVGGYTFDSPRGLEASWQANFALMSNNYGTVGDYWRSYGDGLSTLVTAAELGDGLALYHEAAAAWSRGKGSEFRPTQDQLLLMTKVDRVNLGLILYAQLRNSESSLALTHETDLFCVQPRWPLPRPCQPLYNWDSDAAKHVVWYVPDWRTPGWDWKRGNCIANSGAVVHRVTGPYAKDVFAAIDRYKGNIVPIDTPDHTSYVDPKDVWKDCGGTGPAYYGTGNGNPEKPGPGG